MKPILSAKNESGDFDKFTGFMRQLVAVPHSKIKAQLGAEKEANVYKAPPPAASGRKS